MTHDEAEDFLAHFGKKGMKWGQRMAARDAEILRDRTTTGLRGLGIKNLTGQSPIQKQIRAQKKVVKSTPEGQKLKALKRTYDEKYISATRSTGKEWAATILVSAGIVAVAAAADYGLNKAING